MRQLTPKRLSAWLLTLIMLMGMLPAMASADEADDDPSPPAPQEDYGYVRLVFDEGEQLDLHHGEYITECSPTAEVFGNAGENFITDGEYAALYYEGRLYHKAALDGVSINADAVLSADDFALVPMGGLTTQTPPSSTEPVALTVEGTTEGTTEGSTEGTTEGTTGGTNGGTNGGPTGGTTEQQKTLPPTTLVRKAPMLTAGEVDYGSVTLNFPAVNYTPRKIVLHSGEYITACDPDARVWSGVPNAESDYLVWYLEGILFLNGNLQDVRINLRNAKRYPPQQSVLVRVVNDVVMSGYDVLLDLGDGPDAKLQIDTGKSLTLNLTKTAQSPGRGYAIYGREGAKLTICGGGELSINTVGRNEGKYYAGGIVLSGGLTLENDGGSPYVNIKVTGGTSGFNGDQAIGIDVRNLKVKDSSTLKITIESGRDFDPENEGWTKPKNTIQKNYAISAGTMEVLDKASVEIESKKNVVTDVLLGGGDGTALMVDTEGCFNIWNHGNIVRYPETDTLHTRYDHPYTNILTGEDAKVKLIRAEQGVSIDSESTRIEYWATEGSDCWAIAAKEIELGPDMYQGNCPYEAVQENGAEYYRGEFNYIWSSTGVATVKVSRGLIMQHEVPPGASSSVYFAKVIEPEREATYVVRKGDELKLTAPEGKGKFLYWYDALHPEGSGNGTSWTKPNQTFTNIRQDMVLVPVRDPMTAGPTLSDVGYSVQWDKGVTKQTRYAYQDMTFAKANDIISTGGYRVMLVPAQLPAYGVNTYAVDDLKGNPLMGLRSARLYADKNAYGSTNELGNWHFNVPPGSYRIACMDDDSNYCFISKPFTFDPPVAPPYISPDTKIYDAHDGGVKTVTITAEREAPIKYCLWDYAKNKWGPYNDYTGPFDVTVTAAQDVRIEAYAGAPVLNRRSEVRYALRPTGVPTVKHGDTVVSDGIGRYFYGSIDLTVEAPEGYEVWYLERYQPYESDGVIVGTKVENGKVTVTDIDSIGILYFKLAKAFTLDGVTYRKLSHQETSVHLTKLDTLPAPAITVTTKEGGQTLIPDGSNTYTMTENVVTVELKPAGNWPLDATIAYDTNGNATPRLSTSYTKPFDVRGAGTISVFTLVPTANGEYAYERTAYTFKLAESLQTVQVSTYNGNCTAYYMKEDGTEVMIPTDAYSQALKVGTRVRVVPNTPAKKVFKKWEISNYDEYNIWGAYGGNELYNPELIFHVPKPNYSSPTQTKILGITATFGTAAEAAISGQTLVGLDMSKTVSDSISLWYTTKEMRTISFQWWVGDRAGNENDALPGAVRFDPDKTYTVKVTIKANPGACFTTTASVGIGSHGGHFMVPDNKIIGTYDTLTFTATPIRQIDLTMPAPLTVGDPLPTAAQIGGLPKGVTVQELTWPYTTGNTVPETEDGTVRAALTLKTDGTRPILTREYPNPTVNGEISGWYARNNNYDVTDGSKVTINIDLPVKSKGVSVSGTVKSYNPNNAVTIQLMQEGAEKYKTTIAADTGSGQKEQTFSFDAVAAGTYDLVVTKPGHLSYTVKGVVVGDGPLDLTKHSNAAISTITLLCGDIDGNGFINSTDLGIILKGQNYGKSTATAGDKAADLDGNGFINSTDLGIVLQGQHYGKSAISVSFAG